MALVHKLGILGQVRNIKNLKQDKRTVTSKSKETDEEFDRRYENYFKRTDLDGWEVRKAMMDLHAMDLVPDPKIIISAFHACRRLNDYALAIRFLESIRIKCGYRVNTIFPYIMQEIGPTMKELGISSLEEMGYDKPELALPDFPDP